MPMELGVSGSPLLPQDSSEWLLAKKVVAPNLTEFSGIGASHPYP